MKIHYDLERIDKLLHDVYTITGLTIGFWDNHMNLMATYPAENSDFCREIRSTAKGLERCIECDRVMLRHCATTHRACTRICHAGLPDSALPLYYQDQLLGFVTYGQLINTSIEAIPYEDILERLHDLDIDTARLKEAYLKLPHYDDRKLEAVTTVVSACIRYTVLEKLVSAKGDSRYESILTFIEQHLHEPLHYDMLTHEFHISKSALYELFQQQCGMPVHAYIEKKRMERAAEQLRETDKSVMSIALGVGITDQNYFTRRFKKHYELSPLKYRGQHLNK